MSKESGLARRLMRYQCIPALAVALAGCASQPLPAGEGHPGFVAGVGHGLTALFALLSNPVFHHPIYAYPNDGFLYDLGFCVGFIAFISVLVISALPFIGGFMTRGR